MALALYDALKDHNPQIVVTTGFIHAYVVVDGLGYDWEGQGREVEGRTVDKRELIALAIQHGVPQSEVLADKHEADSIIANAKETLTEVYADLDYDERSMSRAAVNMIERFSVEKKRPYHKKKVGNYELWIPDLNKATDASVFIVGGGNPVGFLNIYKLAPKAVEVSESFLLPELQGQKLGMAMYDALLDAGLDLYSDGSHTKASRGVWSALARNPNNFVAIVSQQGEMRRVTDTSPAYAPLGNPDHPAIWDRLVARRAKADAPVTESVERKSGEILYHGSSNTNIEKFTADRNMRGQVSGDARGCISFSTSYDFASDYAGEHGRVYAVRLLTTNVGDYENPKDVAQVKKYHRRQFIEQMAAMRDARPDIWTDEAVKEKWQQWKIYQHIEAGAYQYWERPKMWSELGWDGAWMIEKNASQNTARNISIADPSKVEIIQDRRAAPEDDDKLDAEMLDEVMDGSHEPLQDHLAIKHLERDYEKSGMKANRIATINGFEIRSTEWPLHQMPHLFIMRDGECVGQMKLFEFDEDVFTTAYSYLVPDVRNKGLGLAIYSYLIDAGYTLRSDFEHTASSKALWRKLAQRYYVTHSKKWKSSERVTNADDHYDGERSRFLASKLGK